MIQRVLRHYDSYCYLPHQSLIYPSILPYHVSLIKQTLSCNLKAVEEWVKWRMAFMHKAVQSTKGIVSSFNTLILSPDISMEQGAHRLLSLKIMEALYFTDNFLIPVKELNVDEWSQLSLEAEASSLSKGKLPSATIKIGFAALYSS